ncbi:MAG: class I SAM-dependent methyltransferase [Pseudomonadota bacterium]
MSSSKNKKNNAVSQAASADKHDLYEQSVQDVEAEIDFIDDTYRALRGKKATLYREDFCGTASASCEWVRRRNGNHAVGVDFDRATLDWGLDHRVSLLSSEAQLRLKLVHGDVLEVTTELADIVGAFNFSYFTFKDRATLSRYFRNVRKGLAEDGLFILDAFGGSEAHSELKEKTKHDGFTYVWHQKRFEPVTGHMLAHIHFHFGDGSKMKKAFTYDWRLWTLPEIQELLLEAGFGKVSVYWEGTDEDGDANGEFAPSDTGDADPAWVAYIVAEPAKG